MDTQGTFDSNSTVFENAFIFALTLMVSSVTVYNIMHNLQEDNLQHLSFFAEYGVLALDAYHVSPFQVDCHENLQCTLEKFLFFFF